MIARSDFDLPADVPVSRLSVADQKKVEILKAVARNARLIVMDEPTAALPDDEAAKLIGIVSLVIERRSLGSIQIRLDWRNLITGEIQTTFV